MRKRLILTCRFPEAVLERASRDYDAVINRDDRFLTREELIGLCQEADGAVISVPDKITAEVVAAMPSRFRIFSTFSVGTEHIDVAAAQARGIAVGNSPHGVTVATAEVAMLLVLGAARRAPEAERMVLEGRWLRWTPTQLLGRRLDGKRLAILGMGRIGQALARRARAFDMEIHYHNRRRLPAAEEQGAVYHAGLSSLLGIADVLSLNAPATPETRHILRAETIAQLKPGAIVVNTARGDLVRDEDLIAALRSGHVAYAGLDVFQGEPRLDERYLSLPNVYLLPHIGSATVEARNQMGFEALDNCDALFAGRPLPFPVLPG